MRKAALLVVALAVTVSCGSPPDPGVRFDDEGQNADLTCLKHQPEPPGPRYTDTSLRRTEDTLALLRYYTAHGRKPYCDNQGPTEADRGWTRLYVELGAAPGNVPRP